MATTQAQAAATPVQAASSVDAGNQETEMQDGRASEMAAILDQMNVPPETGSADEEIAEPLAEPAAEGEAGVELASSSEAEPEQAGEAEAGTEVDSAEDKKNPNAKNFRGRWDHLNEQERRVVELTTKRGLSLEEAYRAVYGDAKPEGQQAAAVAQPETAAMDGELQQAEAAVADLEKQLAAVESDLKARTVLREELLNAKAAREPGFKAADAPSRTERGSALPAVPEVKPAGTLPPAAPAPKRTARPVATGGSAPVNVSFDQQARQALASNNMDALLAAMREGGTQFTDLIK